MTDKTQSSVQLAKLVLQKYGIDQNLKAILVALEERISDQHSPTDAGDLSAIEGLTAAHYAGGVTSNLSINLTDNMLDLSADQIQWLTCALRGNVLKLSTTRTGYGDHQIKLMLSIPISPTDLTSDNFWNIITISIPKLDIEQRSILAIVDDDDTDKLEKAMTLYSLS